jgi:4-hydroxy-tetrahydrodipicolinate reductase
VVGTTGLQDADVEALDTLAREREIPCLVAPNFALGAILMMRFAEEAAHWLPRAEIVELHDEAKLDAPSGTAKATAALLEGDVPIHSVRLPGLVAHQEVLLGGRGQLLTIRHDTLSREAFVPGVLLALERLEELPAGVTLGIDRLVA